MKILQINVCFDYNILTPGVQYIFYLRKRLKINKAIQKS